MIDFEDLLSECKKLDPLPVSLPRLAEIVAKGDPDVDEIERVITLDAAMTTQVLSRANSVASASQVEITSVRDAVVRAGPGPLLMTLTAAYMRPMMEGQLSPCSSSEKGLWRHSVASSLAAESLKRRVSVTVPPAAMTAALLHNIGELVLARLVCDAETEEIERLHTEMGMSYDAAQEMVLGYTDAGAGAVLASEWELPDPIVMGIQHRHTPDAGGDIVCDVVHLASIAAELVGADEGELDDFAPSGHSLSRLGLHEGDVEAVRAEVAERLDEVLEQYS